MQTTDMRAFRSLHLCKNLRTLSSLYPNPIITCNKSRNYPQFPKKFHSTRHRRFPSSTSADESAASSWSVFPHSPPPVDSPSQQNATVQTVYDPPTGRLLTKREYNGGEESGPGVEKAENPPNVEVGTRVYGDIIGSSSVSSSIRKKGKSRIVYVCESCGYSDGQWWGTCKQCEETGTMKQFTTESANRKVSGIQVSENMVRSWLPKVAGGPTPIKLTDVYGQIDESNWRIPLPGLFGAEVERVLGGGLVPGSLVLVGGDPGVGKSTLLLQMLHMLLDIFLYAEEGFFSSSVCNSCFILSVEQIGNRADRLCIKTEELFLYSSTNIEDILEQAKRLSPRAVVIDSIQTVYLEGVTGSAGGDVQVKECTSALLRFAKKTNIPVLLIGHVTKTGDIAGPRVLEHIVDVVLYMEVGA
ncbi:UNVERIFIED_CONTAM: DNA repair protein RadA [Sesamum angustifolium]|uniref:DNA repair protein RadA n=1 Tax=Sesamum angustifolium TaxID=2727405 RepID=A0AAW2LK44_9LAMI